MVIFPAICNTNVQLLFQRYEKNRKGKPCGGRKLRKKRTEALEVARKTSLRLCGQPVYRNSSMNKSVGISDKEYKEWVKRNIYYCKQFYLLYSPALETLPQAGAKSSEERVEQPAHRNLRVRPRTVLSRKDRGHDADHRRTGIVLGR